MIEKAGCYKMKVAGLEPRKVPQGGERQQTLAMKSKQCSNVGKGDNCK